MGDAKLFEAVS